jgi:hypothetical protein
MQHVTRQNLLQNAKLLLNINFKTGNTHNTNTRYKSSSCPCAHHEGIWAEIPFQSFLTLALDGGQWSASSTDHFKPRKSTQHSLNRKLGQPHSQSRCSCPCQKRNHNPFRRPTCSLVTIPTTLSWIQIIQCSYKHYETITWCLLCHTHITDASECGGIHTVQVTVSYNKTN